MKKKMPINILTPIVNQVQKLWKFEPVNELASNESIEKIAKESMRGMSEFMLIGSVIPASIMAGAIKAFQELSLPITQHPQKLLFASVSGALAVNIPFQNAVYGSCFQLLYSMEIEQRGLAVELLKKHINAHPDWNQVQKKRAWAKLRQAAKEVNQL